MSKTDTLYFDNQFASCVGFDYILSKKKGQFEVVEQVFLQVDRHGLRKNKEYVFFTSLRTKKFLEVLSELYISPASYKVKRVGLFKKKITVMF